MDSRKLNRYIEQTIKNFPNMDSMMIIDLNGVVRYYYTSFEDVSGIEGSEILGRKLFEFYPQLDEENSYFYKCIKTGNAFLNYEQILTDIKGKRLRTISSTVPIKEKSEVVAIAELAIYPDKHIDGYKARIDIVEQSGDGDFEGNSLDEIITVNRFMQNLKYRIKNSYESDSAVLVYGETGTGKELVIRAVQQNSKRKNGPFIVQNCAAIPSALLEGLLFGNVKGSFTGAENRAGLFEIANHGTLFLDEINSMEIDAQAKILRAIEEKKIRRLGSDKAIDVDVRIVAAVNKDPLECIENGTLRDDLYYRLSVIRYDIPPLRDRKEDIPVLMEYFRKKFNKEFDRNIREYSNDVKKVFLRYNWPGNVRELRNVIESSFQMNFGLIIDTDELPLYIKERMNLERVELTDIDSKTLPEIINAFEYEIIKRKYIKNNYRLTKTANDLGISKQNLRYKLKKYGFTDTVKVKRGS